MFILERYMILAIRFNDDSLSYISNTNPLIWHNRFDCAKKFATVNDVYNELGKDYALLVRYKNIYPNIKGIELLYYDHNHMTKKERFIS